MKKFRPWAYFRDHFSARIFLTLSLLIFIGTLAFTVFFFVYQSSSLTEKAREKGELLASLLAYNARLGVFTENSDLLAAPVNSTLQDPQVQTVVIYGNDGKVLALQHRPGGRPGAGAEKWDTGIPKTLTDSVPFVALSNSDSFVFWTRVTLKPLVTDEDALYIGGNKTKAREQTIGFIKLIMDSRFLKKSLHSLLLASILIGLALLLVGSALAYHLSQKITKPLNRLTEGVNAFGMEGKYKEITVETGDEIGNLAAAFNNMVTSLKRRETEKELLEEKLRQSQKMEAIGTLAGGVAHDFNNILMAINGYGMLIQSDLAEENKLWSYAEQIVKAGERAANLTQRLLAFTRKQIMSPRPLVIDDVITNIEKMLARLITEDIELELCLNAPNAVVVADPGQLDQVFINLVANARDAMPQGGTITISSDVVTLDDQFVARHELEKAGKYALIKVIDKGVGIANSIKDKIFDPFFTTKEVGKGTGLGLSMVYGVIRQHNGIIEVDTEVGYGSSFTVYLPLIVTAREIEQEKERRFVPGNQETILIAEDDAAVMGLLEGLLERNGYNTITATNGEEAIEKFREAEENIELLLLDVIMPKRNGKEVFEEIARIRPGIRALFISGYTSDVIDRKGVLPDGSDLIAKPVQPDELLEKLREMLDDRH